MNGARRLLRRGAARPAPRGARRPAVGGAPRAGPARDRGVRRRRAAARRHDDDPAEGRRDRRRALTAALAEMAIAVSELVVIFRTQSRRRGEHRPRPARGRTASRRSSRRDVPHSIFPLTVNELGEVRIAVHAEDADEARRIIDSHRTELHDRAGRAGCATSSRRCSARSATASAIAGCSSTR